LLAPPFAAHHEQAAVGYQVRGRNELPGAFEQFGIQLLHQAGNHVDVGAAAVQQRNQACDLRGGRLEAGHIPGILDLDVDEVGMVGQKTEQVQGFQHAGNVLALGHHHPVYLVPDHDGQGIAQLVAGPHLDE